jgi:hypothetical protein
MIRLKLAKFRLNTPIVPTLLVFGIIPRLSADGSLLNQHDRMLAMDSARREMDTIVSELRIKRALSSKTPPGAIRVYLPGELVYVYRERPAKWIGPFPITKIDGKTVYVRDGQDKNHFQSPLSNLTIHQSTLEIILCSTFAKCSTIRY